MDHIPCLEGDLWQHIRAPFLCRESYDGLSFSEYPVRKGWQSVESDTIEFDQRSPDESSAFLQTWLFFGMLMDVLDIPVALKDFIQDGYVTTKRLSQYTYQWYERLSSMSEEYRQDHHPRAQRCLMKVRDCCFTLLDESKPNCPLTSEICLSIRILGESLSQAKHWIWINMIGKNPTGYIDIRSKWGNSKLLERHLLERKWCPNHIAFLQDYPPASSNSGLYYASSLHRPRQRVHTDCSIEMCVASQTDTNSYQTKHSTRISPKCDGRCAKVQPSLDAIRTVLQAGGIPLLSTSISNGQVQTQVLEYKAGIEYVAISHVWSDGLGNQNHNWLPECQMIDLIQACEIAQGNNNITRPDALISQPGTTTVLFWIDTIYMPQADKDITFRHMSLARMAATYQKATAILVLDQELYHTPLGTNIEAVMRLLCSNWMRRLWTLQEGIFAHKLLILFQNDTLLDLWQEIEELKIENKKTPWICNPLISYVIRTGIQQSVRKPPSGRITWLSSDMNWRSTTRKTDEALILTNLLDISIPNLYSTPAQDRMKLLISKMKFFPPRIIFAPGPRFQEEGYRWCLKSFTERSSFTLGSRLSEIRTHTDSHSPSIVVSYPGYIIKGVPRQPIFGFKIF